MLSRIRLLAVFGLAAICAIGTGCAVSLSEARPARVLRGGELQVSEANSVVLPVRVLSDVIDPGKKTVELAQDQRRPSNDEAKKLAGAATAIALAAPGYAAHLDLGVGLGHRWDASARIGNGIYALSLRRGFDVGNWDASVGVRVGYNTGGSLVPYMDELNDFVKVSDLRRVDTQLFGSIGREFGEWGKLWLGAKGMYSGYELQLDGSQVELGEEAISDSILYYGGFVGGALGFRWIHFIMELSVLYARGEVSVFGDRYDLSGVTVVRTWGLQGSF